MLPAPVVPAPVVVTSAPVVEFSPSVTELSPSVMLLSPLEEVAPVVEASESGAVVGMGVVEPSSPVTTDEVAESSPEPEEVEEDPLGSVGVGSSGRSVPESPAQLDVF